MRIECARQGNAITIAPKGLLTGADVDKLQEQLAKAIEEGQAGVVLDASGIAFADSRGLETLVDAAGRLIRNGRTLRLAGPNPTLFEVLELTDIAPVFRLFDDLQAALESCR